MADGCIVYTCIHICLSIKPIVANDQEPNVAVDDAVPPFHALAAHLSQRRPAII